MIEINLIPNVKLELLRARRQRKMVISVAIVTAVASVAIVTLMASYAFGVQALADTLADNGINDQSKKLQSIDDLSKTLTIQSQLNKLSSIQSEKKVSSRLFDIVGVAVPSGKNQIRITKLNLDTEMKSIEIEAEAANGYESMEVFKKTLAQTKFQYKLNGETQEEIKIAQTISEGERRYAENGQGIRVLRFSLSFTYPEEIFSPKSEDGKIIAPDQQRATDSAQGVPESLFSAEGSR